jgi:hypothetical protein
MKIARSILFLACSLAATARPASAQEATFRGTPVSTWVDRLKDKDVAVRRDAAAALARRIDKGEPSAEVAKALSPALFDLLKDADTAVRRQPPLPG